MKKKTLFLLLALLVLSPALYLPFRKKEKMLLITGCARSGTTYIAKILQESGLSIGHEKMLKDGVSSWYLACNPQKTKRGANPNKVRFAHVFHQVRHPLKVISSVYRTEDRHSWNYIMKHVPEIKMQDSHLVKCAKYWYYWNLKAENEAEWTYRIEDIDTILDEFGNRIGKKIQQTALEEISKDVNTFGNPKREFTWEDLQKELPPELFEKIHTLAEKYGYF